MEQQSFEQIETEPALILEIVELQVSLSGSPSRNEAALALAASSLQQSSLNLVN